MCFVRFGSTFFKKKQKKTELAYNNMAVRVKRLKPFNGGVPMEGVRLTLRTGTVVVGLKQAEDADRITLRVADDVLPRLYEKSNVAELTPIVVPKVPPMAAETERKMVLGGVGLHTRRTCYADENEGEAGALVSNFTSIESLRNVISRLGLRFATEPPETFDEDGTQLCPIIVEATTLPTTVISLAKHGIFLYCPFRTHSIMADSLNRVRRTSPRRPHFAHSRPPTSRSIFQAPHLYAQQLKYVGLAEVGPTRGLWRYRFGHFAKHWKRMPFSWPGWGVMVLEELIRRGEVHRTSELENPLRSEVLYELARRRSAERAELQKEIGDTLQQMEAIHSERVKREEDNELILSVARARNTLARAGDDPDGNGVAAMVLFTEHIRAKRDEQAARDDAASCSKLQAMRKQLRALNATLKEDSASLDKPHFITPALGEEESEMHIEAFHSFYYDHASLDADQRELLRARLQHLPMTTGYFIHWTSCYEQTGLHVGFGETLRFPEQVASYTAENGFASALNRMRRSHTGKLLGRGGVGYKGLFETPPEQDVYMPDKQLVRTQLHELYMRRDPTR